MEDNNTIEEILKRIEDKSIRLVAEHSLKSSRKALDIPKSARVKQVADDIEKIIPKALKKRGENETS